MTVVRMATPADEAQIMSLCRALHAENAPHSMNEDKVRAMVQRGIARNRAIIGVIGESDDLKGMILLLIDEIWFSDEFQLLELFNYVRPDSRKSTYAKDLINYAKKCAEETGVDLTIGVISNIRTEAKCKLYARLLPKAGEFFIYSGKKAARNAA